MIRDSPEHVLRIEHLVRNSDYLLTFPDVIVLLPIVRSPSFVRIPAYRTYRCGNMALVKVCLIQTLLKYQSIIINYYPLYLTSSLMAASLHWLLSLMDIRSLY